MTLTRTSALRGQNVIFEDLVRRYIITSPDMKTPADFNDFMRNGDNKEMLINLIERTLVEDCHKLGRRIVYFSNNIIAEKSLLLVLLINLYLLQTTKRLIRKLVALSVAHNLPDEQCAMIRSPSGDIDILVLFLLHSRNNIFIDSGCGQARKIIDMASSTLTTELKQAIYINDSLCPAYRILLGKCNALFKRKLIHGFLQ